MSKRRKYSTPEESFEARTEWQGGCLLWTGSKVPDGYGQISVGGKMLRTHRYAWQRVNGKIPSGLVLDHICHNRACCNVDHLRLVTTKQNLRNRSGANPTNTSTGHRNISKKWGKFHVTLYPDGKIVNGGAFTTLEEAQERAEELRIEHYGEYAGRG